MGSREVLASKLIAYREVKEITQKDFATKVGLSTRGLGKIERCEVNTTVETLDMIASAIGITASELLA